MSQDILFLGHCVLASVLFNKSFSVAISIALSFRQQSQTRFLTQIAYGVRLGFQQRAGQVRLSSSPSISCS
jgi:hypothetical protein